MLNENKNTSDYGSINKTLERLRAEGRLVSECALRRWIQNGEIPHRKSGIKAILYYPNVIRYLESGDEKEQVRDTGGIRRVCD